MIDKLGWDTLEKRRAIARVTLLYKIVKGLVVVNSRGTCNNLPEKIETPKITLSNKCL
jgi:hypothetical protein